MLKFHIVPCRKKWKKIINDAFASNDIHVFSKKYIRRREQIKNNFLERNNQEKSIKQI